MIIGPKDYKLIALDTNILREVSMNNENYKKKLFEKFILSDDNYAFCFSIYNVLELRPYEDIFERFVDFFCQTPALMLFPYSLILKKEAECYNTGFEFVIDNNVANAFSYAGTDMSHDFRAFLNEMFNNENLMSTVKSESEKLPDVANEWNKQRDDAIELLKTNGYPLNTIDDKYYRHQEETTIIKDLSLHNINIRTNADYKRFPAARIMEYSQFNRVHLTKKKITANDVVDVELSAMSPYVDVVVTEKFQSNVYKKAKSFIGELKQLEIYTLRDFR